MRPRDVVVGVKVRSSIGTVGTVTEMLGSGRGRVFVVVYDGHEVTYHMNSRSRREMTAVRP